MIRSTLLLGCTALAVAVFAGNAAAASNPACKPSKWSLAVPLGMNEGEAVIVETPENHIWRVGVGGVPPNAMLVIEYKSTVGTKGEVVLNSGAAELVEGSSVTMRLKRNSGAPSKLAVAGTYNIKCGK